MPPFPTSSRRETESADALGSIFIQGNTAMLSRRYILKSSVCIMALAPLLAPAAIRAERRWPLPPHAPKHPKRIERFGRILSDDYAWLKPTNWAAIRKDPEALDPEIRKVLDAENAYAKAMLAPTQPLQDTLFARMQNLTAADVPPPAILEDGWAYYSWIPEGESYPIYARRPASGGAEQILLDLNAEARGKTYYALSVLQAPVRSPDNRLFAWAVDETGSEYHTLYVKDIATGRIVSSDIHDCYGTFAFAPDSKHLFWVLRDRLSRPTKVFRRAARGGTDVEVYDEKDPAFFIHVSLTTSKRTLLIHCFNGDMGDTRVVFGDDVLGAPTLVEPRRNGLLYTVEDWQDDYLILTNANGAYDFKVMRANRANLREAGWLPFIAHQPGHFIAAIRPFRNFLVLSEWRDANPHLIIATPTGQMHNIAFAEAAYNVSLESEQTYDTDNLRYAYETPRLPKAWYEYDMKTAERQLLRAPRRSFEPEHYVVERISAPSSDGVMVPITVLMRKGTKLDGSAPLLMYGYGSYGDSVTASFSAPALALVDQGWIHVLAHVRGGAEKGTRWWRSVLKRGKKKTFVDFIACAEHLIQRRYTRRGQIAIHGLSAGGLLVGAVYNMRPDLWGAAIAQVPFVDLLNTMEDENHPLWFTALPIWGDPRVKADWEYMASYSPYTNVHKAAYPPLLATGSLVDDRVGFWEPVKFVEKVRDDSTNTAPKMVKIDMSAGHMGASGRNAKLRQQAMFYAFAIWAVDNKWGLG
jgi:oligopeptidase B